MQERYVSLRFQIDTNRINARQNLENMNRLETWARNGVIDLDMAEVTLHEAGAGNNPQRTSKAMKSIYSMTFDDTPEEQQLLAKIELILFPKGADTQNKKMTWRLCSTPRNTVEN